MTWLTRHPWLGTATAALALGTALAACGEGGPGTRAHERRAAQESDARTSHSPSPATGRTPRGFSLLATGDLLVHDSIIRQARADAAAGGSGSGYDFRRMLAAAKPLATRADLAICHMETVYGRSGGPFSGYPLFRTPPQLAASVRDTGYDSCSTASNHTLDAGSAGVGRTLAAMDRAGLRHAGSARSRAEASRITRLRAGGARVAQLAYTYGTNGIPLPRGKPWTVDLIDPRRVVADARAARRAGADVVVVSLHWGTEWQQAPDKLQRALARRLTAARSGGRRAIDLIIGTHAHVPQAYEKVNGTWVVYGMGDQIAGKMNDPRGTMGSAARFTFAPPTARGGTWTVRSAEFVPFLMETSPRHTLVNLARSARTDPAHRRAYDTVRRAVLSRGAAEDGLRMGR
ncbi:CapA family protein [Streptomyces boncukensis]|uniref:CapA family protein n=1 Tax=Streptomyces boncukensis TaxID=2711219 RepID=A0A6G4WT11_9ACTN|nr:CapA family protein [Streptomyces boncukensis]NGO67780.1 CapA family protein [Streptomyces boncukensis]